jgi:hypothetical protein
VLIFRYAILEEIKNMKQRLLIFLLYLTPSVFFAQITKEKFFTTAIGATWQNRRDDLFSPITFRGIGAELRLGREKISETRYTRFDASGSFSDMKSNIKNGYNYSTYGIYYSASYTWTTRIWKDKKDYAIYVGGAFLHQSSIGIYNGNVNNIFSYNAPTGFAGVAYVQRPLRFFKRNWIASTQFTLPFLVYDARPTYIGFVSTDNLLKEYGIGTFNKLLDIDWRWQLALPLTNGNQLRASYRWHFMNDWHNGLLQMGSQGLALEMMINFPYKVKKEN